jgi:deoxyadenosine/deoxycytidine kinase
MKLIYIEGNIGSGKTSIMEMIQHTREDDDYIEFLFEPVTAWRNSGLFDLFYSDPTRYAFAFQVMVLTSRIEQLQQVNTGETEIVIMERSLDTCGQVFGKMLHDQGKISDMEWTLYQKLLDQYDTMIEVMLTDENGEPQDVETIWVCTEPEICRERIAKRNRKGEQVIDLGYLKDIERYHEQAFTKHCVTKVDNNKELKNNKEWNKVVARVMGVLSYHLNEY